MARAPKVVLATLCALFAFAALPSPASAQAPQPLPLPKGTRLNVKIDSSPQQAAIYVNDKAYGIQGYTPMTLKLPKGTYKLILELPNFKRAEVPVTVTRAQAFTITLERAPRPAVLDFRAAADNNALGATIVVDGTSVGTLPNRVEVGAGNHVVEVNKPGFLGYRDNIQVTEGETRTLVVPLAAQVKPGSLLVTADVPNATVFVDGVQKDTAPAMIPDLPEGPHTVEVRALGQNPWKQVVNVIGGQQVKVAAQLLPAAPPPPVAGSLKVISATEGADVFLDGEPKGPAGSTIKNVEPGTHVVEVRAPGHVAQRASVEVVAGQVKTIPIDLVKSNNTGKTGTLRVISPVPDVEVFIDGASVGKAPVERKELQPGKHFVVARKAGFTDFKLEVDLQTGSTQEVAADLRAVGALRVISNPPGATVLLDGTTVGATPLSLAEVSVGQHVVEFRLKDYLDGKKNVTIEGGGQHIVQEDLVAIQRGPTVADLERAQREQSSWGALTLDRSKFTVDLGAGYPHWLFARLTTGLFRIGNIGMDLGIELRTNFVADTQVGLRPRVQLLKVDPFSLGVDVTILGGGGPTRRNSFTFELGVPMTITAGQYVHFNVKPYLGVWSDRLCPSVDDIKEDDNATGVKGKAGSGTLYTMDEKEVCKAFDVDRPAPDNYLVNSYHRTGFALNQQDPRERHVTVRGVLQVSVEVAVSKSLSVFGMIEGAPFQGGRINSGGRPAFTSTFNSIFPDEDFPLYGRAGVTGKF